MGRSDRQYEVFKYMDWLTVLFYLILVFMGWISIYAAVYDENFKSILDISQRYGKQLMWITVAIVIALVVLFIDSKVYTNFSIPIYILILFALVSVLFLGKEVHGARSWFQVGSIRIQPAEFAKVATCLAVSYIMSRSGFKVMKMKHLILLGVVICLPALLIIAQNDTGSALVYSSFIMVLYREGLHGSVPLLMGIAVLIFICSLLYPTMAVISIIIVLSYIFILFYSHRFIEVTLALILTAACFGLLVLSGRLMDWNIELYEYLLISFAVISVATIIYFNKKRIRHIIPIIMISWLSIGGSFGVNFAFSKLQPHQQDRINLLLGKTSDPHGAGYNVIQSKIAIGSGGFLGKGFLKGTQTKYDFVPEQSTDFIFCTVGEEWGFLGSSLVIVLMVLLITRLVYLAERQRSRFSRIYGYGVIGILFFHLMINVGMTIGLMPVVGIPLPFFSYGGSSLWAFTILLFIFLKLDSNRMQILS